MHEFVRQRNTSKGKLVRLIDKYGVDSRDDDGYTPFMIACRNGDLVTAQRLQELGADVDACTTTGKTPFMIACWDGLLNIARFLKAAGCNCQARDKSGKTAFDLAQIAGQHNFLMAL
jgi:ankyrin repeat protein